MSEVVAGVFVDRESPLARRVAGEAWAGFSRAALAAGHTKARALWADLGGLAEPEDAGSARNAQVGIFVVGQDKPDAVERLGAWGSRQEARLYGVVVAVPERPSPLSGALLYQGVEGLTGAGVKAGAVEPALLRAVPAECEAYARRLLERLRALQEA